MCIYIYIQTCRNHTCDEELEQSHEYETKPHRSSLWIREKTKWCTCVFSQCQKTVASFFYFCRLPFCAMHGKFYLLVGRVKTPLDLRPFNCLAPRNIQLSVLCKAVDCLENGGTSALSKIDVWLKHAFQASRGKFVEIWRFLSLRWCFHLSEATKIYLVKLT